MNLSRFHTQANTSFQYINPPSLSPLFLLSSFSLHSSSTTLLCSPTCSGHQVTLFITLLCSQTCSVYQLAARQLVLLPTLLHLVLCFIHKLSLFTSFVHSCHLFYTQIPIGNYSLKISSALFTPLAQFSFSHS